MSASSRVLLPNTSADLDVQSKECQKLHWKVAHKAVCDFQAELHKEHLREDPNEKAKVKKFNRWINAWSLALTACSPIALDLANHQWDRHETHTYDQSPTSLAHF